MTHSFEVMEILGASAVGLGLMTAAMAILSTSGADRRGRGAAPAVVVLADVFAFVGCLVGSGARDGGAEATAIGSVAGAEEPVPGARLSWALDDGVRVAICL
jgi:hypothetical protein